MANDGNHSSRRLPPLGILLLGLAASISVSASVPLRTTPPIAIAAAAGYDAVRLIAATPGFPHSYPRTACPQPTPPFRSVGRHSFRRVFVFVEDTTPPSTDRLQTARLHAPMQPEASPPQALPPRRNIVASPSNRQRAP